MLVEPAFETFNEIVGDRFVAGHAQLAAEIEQVVLDFLELSRDRLGQPVDGEHHADAAVQLVDGAVGLDAVAVLSDAAAVAEAGGAGIAGAGVDLAEAVAHGGVSRRKVIQSAESFRPSYRL